MGAAVTANLQKARHVGPIGAGAMAKLAHNCAGYIRRAPCSG